MRAPMFVDDQPTPHHPHTREIRSKIGSSVRRAAGQRKAIAAVARWNSLFPSGEAVLVRMDSGEIRTTKTRSAASMLGAEPSKHNPGHTAVIWLEGISGCYDLTRVRAIREIFPG